MGNVRKWAENSRGDMSRGARQLRAHFPPFFRLSDFHRSGRKRIALEHCCANGHPMARIFAAG